MADDALQSRRRHRGVIGIESKVPIRDRSVLSLIYTPGVAEPCLAIHADPQKSFEYTSRGNTIALVTDGANVLDLANRGHYAAMHLLDGDSVLLQTFRAADALPHCLNNREVDGLR